MGLDSSSSYEDMQGTSGGCNLLAAGKHAREVLDGVRKRGARIGERTDWHRKEWITPEIVQGGFSTGRDLAGGFLKPHEAALILQHSIPTHGVRERRAINEWCLTSSAGRAWLLDLSRTGLYRLPTAEEGCLLAVVILEEAGIVADHIIQEVSPWFDELRFFPEPAEHKAPDGSLSSVKTSGDLVSKLGKRLQRFKATLVSAQFRSSAIENVYLPTYRAIVDEAQRVCAWWLDDSNAGDGGGLAPGFAERLATKRVNLILFGFEKKMRRSSLWKLFDALEVVALHGRQTRRAFIEHIRRHAEAASTFLARRCSIPPAPLMSPHRQSRLFQLRGLMKELKPEEHASSGLPMDRVTDLSSRFPLFRAEVERVALGTLQELADLGVLASPEQLAIQGVRVVVKHRAEHFAPEPARTLALHLLTAFMARRSRLLLNLETQVRVSEIPWFGAIADAFDTEQQPADPCRVVAVNPVAREVFGVHVTCFPDKQMPNRLVRLLDEYLGCKGLVKEIAADIFQGAFRSKFGTQAKQREEILGPGTPYGDYYAKVLIKFPDDAAVRTVEVKELQLGLGFEWHNRYSVVDNGIVIEQVAVATTHNLLHLLVALGMDKDAALLDTAASVALSRLVERLRSMNTDYRFLRDESRRAAAACRAFLVFVSLLKKEVVGGGDVFVTRLNEDAAALTTAAAQGKFPSERATVLRDILVALEGQGGLEVQKPLLGWSKNGRKHPVFYT